MAYPDITSNEEAQEMGWLEEPYLSNGFLERYNDHQKYLADEDGGACFVCSFSEVFLNIC